MAQIKMRRKNFLAISLKVFCFAAVSVFAYGFYESWNQYLVWQSSGPPAEYFLPPHRGISYFLGYSFYQFFFDNAVSFSAALIFLLSAAALNKLFGERFFEKREPYLGATCLFLAGHPLWLFYVPLVFVSSFLAVSFYLVTAKKNARLPLYYFWLPAALIILLIKILQSYEATAS